MIRPPFRGVGALFIRGGSNAIPMEPLWYGGGQENGLRSGTMNVPNIVGFGEACRICHNDLPHESKRIQEMRDFMEKELLSKIEKLIINGVNALRIPNTSSLTFPGIDADALITNAPEIMIGTGSACASGALEPSHVLTAIGLSRENANSTVRISLGRFTRDIDIEISTKSLTIALIQSTGVGQK